VGIYICLAIRPYHTYIHVCSMNMNKNFQHNKYVA
jgi:hypothetical protein